MSMLKWVFGAGVELKIFDVVILVVIVGSVKKVKLDEFLEGVIYMLF
jgi:hypothetical protein